MCVGVDITAARWAEHEKVRQHSRSKRRDILNDGIQRHLSQEEMLGALKQLGITLEAPFVMHVLAIPAQYMPTVEPGKERMERQHHIDQLIDYLQDSAVGVVWQTRAGIAVIQSRSSPEKLIASVETATAAGYELIKIASRNWVETEINVGVTHSTDEVHDVADLFEQACAALQYGPGLAAGRSVYHWHDLGCFQFIVKNLQLGQVKQFVQEHLGPILNAGNAADGLATLKALLSGDSFQVIANRLHVHKQTIVFRKKKLEDTLKVDLSVPATRTNLFIALKLLSILS
jgi:sugar diacid utilization regulator